MKRRRRRMKKSANGVGRPGRRKRRKWGSSAAARAAAKSRFGARRGRPKQLNLIGMIRDMVQSEFRKLFGVE